MSTGAGSDWHGIQDTIKRGSRRLLAPPIPQEEAMSTETQTDPVAAYLAGVRQRADWVRKTEQSTATDAPYTLSVARRNSARDVRPLLAAIEAVRALTRDTDGNDLLGEAEVPVGEFQAAIWDALAGEGE